MNDEKFATIQQKIELDYENITGVIVQKKDQLLYEKYFNECNETSKIHVYSIAKSILSLLFGIAQKQGMINELDRPILDYFPEYQPKDSNIGTITLENLLTMTTPYKYKNGPLTYIKYFMSKDWTKFTLKQLGGKHPIGQFNYTPLIGPDLLSAILARSTKKSVLEFAREELFEPLGINVEKAIQLKSAKEQMAFNQSTTSNGWVEDNTGLNAGGWGLTLSTRDLTRLGQLILNQGNWKNQQIIPESWLQSMQSKHSHWAQEQLDYGYLWWVVDPSKPIIAAMGDGGNILYIDHEKELVVAITALFKENVYDRIDFIQQEILPLL
ncbi:penicillin-binding protein [Enterococcus avium]|uniref:serine hydrolase domain-containing protein n=1 Tax=Enterococcus malodoratus TaxID=71451 RepID=UPI0008D4A2CA|nr:serine hydrolase [Enterococcus malodoratus]BBM17858.1 penicillin-binding protein [Enterococcus avium]SET39287.1 CubicO group peptidase, beta-lactamase class C family [Enterococcus malodoratus]